jgi:glycosyltransferase involved in cell wall biosynthesis
MREYRYTLAVSTRILIPGRLEGIGRFTHELLRRIVPAMPDVHFIFFFDRRHDPSFLYSENITPIECFPPTRHAFLYYVWLQHSVKPFLKKLSPHLFFSPDGLCVLGTKTPQLPVIHDLNFEHYPEFHRFWAGRYYRFFFPRFAKNAFQIITVSEFSKKDIQSTYHIPEEKIWVVPNGTSSHFRPLDEEEKKKVREKFSKGKKYFVYVGSLHPRKNITGLIQSFCIFKKNFSGNYALVLAGPPYWGMNEIHKAIRNHHLEHDVILTRRLSDEDLALVLGAAEAMVFVPFFEGFGIPILEAFACQVPVIASNVTSIPEVCENGAILVNPHQAEEIARAMNEIITNTQLRQNLIKKSQEALKKYSWDHSAELLKSILYKALENITSSSFRPTL